MEITAEYLNTRQEAVSWLKTDKRDFQAGLKILLKSGYKPHVAAKISKWGDISHSKQKLEYEMGEFIKVWADPNGAQHQDIDFDGEETTGSDLTVTDELLLKIVSQAQAENEKEDDENQLPASIRKIIYTISDDYKARSVLHKQLTELPEDNSEATVAQRKAVTAGIAALSKQMTLLYNLKKKYDVDGTVPTDEEMDDAFFDPDSEENKDNDEGKEDLAPLPETKEELKKLRKSEATKLLRARNMLLYQQETKAEKENPMPESPKRVKYETKVSTLEKRVSDIEYKIAALG